MGLTTVGANLFLDILLGQNQADLATYYMGLVTVEPDTNDTGTTISEPVGGSYARIAVTNNNTFFADAEAAEKTNATTLNFPQASGNWGTMTHMVICDASTGGNLLAWGRLTTPIEVVSGRQLSFIADALSITASG